MWSTTALVVDVDVDAAHPIIVEAREHSTTVPSTAQRCVWQWRWPATRGKAEKGMTGTVTGISWTELTELTALMEISQLFP